MERTRRARNLLVAMGVIGLCATGCAMTIRMPGTSYKGMPPPLSGAEEALVDTLRRDVTHLAGTIGERNVHHPSGLAVAADWIDAAWTAAGYQVSRQGYEVHGRTCYNLEVELKGTVQPAEIVVVGAHYDSVVGTVGANDNGSGVAALLALGRAFAGKHPAKTLRLVAFVNEEPPWFLGPSMGSLVYATRSRDRGERIVAMLSLETLGYYSNAPESQLYPFPLSLIYPSTGNFIGFVGDLSSRRLVRDLVGSFRRHARFPSEGAAVPGTIPGVGWSDHWSFWRNGYPAVMVTDTAPFRYPYYHTPEDTPDKLTYEPFARVVAGLERVIAELVGIR
jgi:hypothetical protein